MKFRQKRHTSFLNMCRMEFVMSDIRIFRFPEATWNYARIFIYRKIGLLGNWFLKFKFFQTSYRQRTVPWTQTSYPKPKWMVSEAGFRKFISRDFHSQKILFPNKNRLPKTVPVPLFCQGSVRTVLQIHQWLVSRESFRSGLPCEVVFKYISWILAENLNFN